MGGLKLEGPLYKDHPRDQQNVVLVVFIERFNNMKNIPLGSVKCGLYKQVVFLYR